MFLNALRKYLSREPRRVRPEAGMRARFTTRDAAYASLGTILVIIDRELGPREFDAALGPVFIVRPSEQTDRYPLGLIAFADELEVL